VHTDPLSEGNAKEVLAGHDLVLDALDNFPARHILSDAAHALKIPVVFGALQGFDAQLSLFLPEGPCYRCLYPERPNWKPSGVQRGVPGPIPGMLGAWMAMEAIKYILSQQKESADRMTLLNDYILTFDGRTGESSRRRLKKRADCPVCA